MTAHEPFCDTRLRVLFVIWLTAGWLVPLGGLAFP